MGELINEKYDKVEIKGFANGVTSVLVDSAQGWTARFGLLGVDRHGLPSGIYDLRKVQTKILEVAETAAKEIENVLSQAYKRISDEG